MDFKERINAKRPFSESPFDRGGNKCALERKKMNKNEQNRSYDASWFKLACLCFRG